MLNSAGMKNAAEKTRVLLVEDYEPSSKVISFLFEELGYECDTAYSGAEALEKFSQNHYGLIMMDLQLPDFNGLEATRRIRAIEKKKDLFPTPIIGMTGHATDDDRLLCQKAGMNEHLSKPFRLNSLEEKIQEILA